MPETRPRRILGSACRFGLPADTSLDNVTAALHERFRLRGRRAAPCTQRYFDSFDWLLYGAGAVLYEKVDGGRATLCRECLDDGGPAFEMPGQAPPRFARTLPPGPLREELVPVLKYRALLPVVEVRGRRRVLRLLDDEDKTTARLRIDAAAQATDPGSGKAGRLAPTLCVIPVKGYDAAREVLCAFLHDDLGLPALGRHPLQAALDAVGRTPGDYSSKLRFDLDPLERADAAIRRILRPLLDVMVRNEPGLRAGLDTEFLHDFRIAVRRTRSILSQLKNIFPPQEWAHFKGEFAWLGRATGPARDLDVFVIRLDEEYTPALLPSVRAQLAPLHALLVRQQECERVRLCDALDADRYRMLLHAWQAFLEAPLPEASPSKRAARSIRSVASRRIWRIYRRTLDQGEAVRSRRNAPDAAVHDLRIMCKKLRYLMELFASLYPRKALRRSLCALKRLQDTLGDFQDLAVHQRKLHQFARQMKTDDAVQADTLLAMGRLAAYLETRRLEARAQAVGQFSRFARPGHRRHFAALFKPSSA